MSAARVLEVSRAELGTVESPPGSNRTKYGRAYGMDGVAWCAIWCWWIFREAGASALIPKTAYTPTFANWFKQRGQWGTAPRVGALGFMDFPGDGVNRISHVVLVEAVNPDGSITTLEANTSPGTGGSQRDGGGVYRRTRKAGIVGYGYPAYAAPAPSTTVPPTSARAPRFPLPAGHYFGPQSGPAESVSNTWRPRPEWIVGLRAWQAQMRRRGWTIDTDGVYGDQTAEVARTFQAEKRITVDGHIGPVTWRAAWTAPVS